MIEYSGVTGEPKDAPVVLTFPPKQAKELRDFLKENGVTSLCMKENGAFGAWAVLDDLLQVE